VPFVTGVGVIALCQAGIDAFGRELNGDAFGPGLEVYLAKPLLAGVLLDSVAPSVVAVAAVAGLGYAGYSYLHDQGKPKVPLTSALDPEKFIEFPLKKVEPYNHNTAKFIFELPPNTATLLPVTACVVIKSDQLIDGKGKPIVRPYTPISPSDQPEEVCLLVKNYDSGNASKFIHNMKPGDKIGIKGPISKWPYKINEFEEVALIGGGSGITPLYQLLTYALSDPANKTKFKLIFGNVTEADILLREEFDALKKRHPNTFDVVHVLQKPEKDWSGPKGYITADLLKLHVAPPSLGEKVKVFICGPPPQVAALAGKKDGMKQGELGGALKKLGYKDEQVYKF